MRKLLIVLMLFLVPIALTSCSKKAEAGELTLSWEASATSCGTGELYPVEDFGGYRVFIGTVPGVYDFRTDDVGDILSYLVTGLVRGTNYCFAVQSYSVDDQFCSANPYSNEVCADAKAVVPSTVILSVE